MMETRFSFNFSFVIICIGSTLLFSCRGNSKGIGDETYESDTLPKTKIEFSEQTWNFGKIKEGDIVSHTFHFKNTGDNPALIGGVKTSCSCTISEYTSGSIEPGGKGFVRLEMDTEDKEGKVLKNNLVFINVQGRYMRLTIEAEVEKQ